jgi:hypothetical protein
MKKTFRNEGVCRGQSSNLITASDVDKLVGKLLTIIETIGLKEQQEKSLKDIIRQEVYGTVRSAPWLGTELTNVLFQFHWWFKDANIDAMEKYNVASEGEYTLTFSR